PTSRRFPRVAVFLRRTSRMRSPSSPPKPQDSSRASASSSTEDAGSGPRTKLGGGFFPDDSEDGPLGSLEHREAADGRDVHRLDDGVRAELLRLGTDGIRVL